MEPMTRNRGDDMKLAQCLSRDAAQHSQHSADIADDLGTRISFMYAVWKLREFLREPHVLIPSDLLQVLGKRLGAKGFDKAYVLLGQFLVLKKNQELFTEWLKEISGANAKQSNDCFQCLKDWCDEFL